MNMGNYNASTISGIRLESLGWIGTQHWPPVRLLTLNQSVDYVVIFTVACSPVWVQLNILQQYLTLK